MKPMKIDQVVRNIDRRLERVEQILPTLPTRDEMHETLNTAIRDAVTPLVTREEFDRKVATLVTKEEFERKIATLVTKEEFERKIATLATKDELCEEFERSRRHTQVLFESVKHEIRLVAEGLAPTHGEVTQVIRPMLAAHDRRITALEDTRGRQGSGRRR